LEYEYATLFINVHVVIERCNNALEKPFIVIAPHDSPIFVSNSQLINSTAVLVTSAVLNYIVIAAPTLLYPLELATLYLKLQLLSVAVPDP
jgi:hypothetical protein